MAISHELRLKLRLLYFIWALIIFMKIKLSKAIDPLVILSAAKVALVVGLKL